MKSYSLIIFLFVFTASCESPKETSAKKNVLDDLGRKMDIPVKLERVLSISPSMTEMLYLVCEDSQIVGRTQNCNYPPAVLKKPVVNNYPIDYEAILNLKPQVIFAKEGIISLDEAMKFESMNIPVYFQKYSKVEDIFNGILKLGNIFDQNEKAKAIVDSLQSEKIKIENENRGLNYPKVLMVISKEKIFVHGRDSYASDILKIAGGENALQEVLNNPFPEVSVEYILHLNPDIILGGEPVDLEKSFFEIYPELKKINAYKNKKVYTIDEDILSRPGPRVMEGIKTIRKVLHPDA